MVADNQVYCKIHSRIKEKTNTHGQFDTDEDCEEQEEVRLGEEEDDQAMPKQEQP